jgi:2-oxoisovalerate dehydrogenase E1 component alpha subunit
VFSTIVLVIIVLCTAPTAKVEDWKTRYNPITCLRKWLERKNLWDEALEKSTKSGIQKAMLQELTAAEKEKKALLKIYFY